MVRGTPGLWALRAFCFAGMAFLLAPIAVVILSSFTNGAVVTAWPQGWSLRWFAIGLARGDFWAAFGVSVSLGLVVTAISLALGVPTALAIVRGRFPGRGALGAIALSPLLVPNVVLGFAMLTVMASVHLLGTVWAVLIAYVVIVFPFVTRATIGVLQGMTPSVEQAAAVFGASPLTAFFTVTLPLMSRGLIAAAVFAFVVVLDEAVIITFIGDVHTVTFPQRLFAYIAETYDPIASVFATATILVTAVIMIALDRFIGIDRLGAGFGVGSKG